ALVGVSGLALVAAPWARNAPPPNALPPRGSLTFPERVDLGTVERGKVLKASFTIKNQSSRPVLLSDFVADCGCMDLCRQEPSGPAPLDSVLLNAGEELTVSARLEPPGRGDPVF